MLAPHVVLVLLGLVLPVHGQSSRDCTAFNARLNPTRALKTGVDFVPVTDDDALGFYVAYSPHPDRTNTAGMFVFPLQQREALLFGTGYGKFGDAEADADLLDSIFRDCMGRRSVKLRVVAPHAHGDHLNPALIEALRARGHTISEIAFHEDDKPGVDAMAFSVTDKSLFRVLKGAGCNEEILALESWLGRIWFVGRPGHTPGSIDLVLDVRSDPADRVLVRGSLAGGTCPQPPSGVRLTVEPHGTVVLPDGRYPASLGVVNGRGVNRLCLRSSQAPRLGLPWSAWIDTSGVAGVRSLLLFASDRALSPGILFAPGELLVDVRNGAWLATWTQPKDQNTFTLPVPSDPAFLGVEAWFQGWILGDQPGLCNALHIVIGT